MDLGKNEKLLWAAYVAAGAARGVELQRLIPAASEFIDDLRHRVEQDAGDKTNPNQDIREAYGRLWQMVRT